MRRGAFLLGFVGLLAFAWLVMSHSSKLARAQSSGAACCASQLPVAPRELDFPYYSLHDGFQSTLNLVSDSPQPLDFIVALHSLAGQTLLGPSLTIQPSAKLPIDLRSFFSQPERRP
jgi:hypothetical protein